MAITRDKFIRNFLDELTENLSAVDMEILTLKKEPDNEEALAQFDHAVACGEEHNSVGDGATTRPHNWSVETQNSLRHCRGGPCQIMRWTACVSSGS